MKESISAPIHTTHCRVVYGDTDAAGVVYYANYLKYFEIGRTEFMRDWVCSYKEIEKMGIVLPVTECYTRFKAPAFYDDLLTIETSIAALKKFACQFNYRITRHAEDSERPKLLVKGYTVNASINTTGQLTALPPDIIAKLESLMKSERT